MNNNLRFISIPIKILLCTHLNIFVIFGLQKIFLLILFLLLIEEEPCSTREYPSHKLQLPHGTCESCLSIITDITQMTRRRNQSQIRLEKTILVWVIRQCFWIVAKFEVGRWDFEIRFKSASPGWNTTRGLNFLLYPAHWNGTTRYSYTYATYVYVNYSSDTYGSVSAWSVMLCICCSVHSSVVDSNRWHFSLLCTVFFSFFNNTLLCRVYFCFNRFMY